MKSAPFFRVLFVSGFILGALQACSGREESLAPEFVKVESQPVPGGPVLLREGISIRKAATVNSSSIKLAVHPNSGEIYVLHPEKGLSKFDPSQAGDLEEVASADKIVNNARLSGMAFAPDGTLYVVANRTVKTRFNKGIVQKGVQDSTGEFQWTTLFQTESYPMSATYYDHLYNGIAVSPDSQWVYISAGSRTEHGEVQDNQGAFPEEREVALTSKILKISSNSIDIELPNDLTQLEAMGVVYAYGTRNAYDMAFAPNGDLFAIDNGPDGDYPDELNWIREGLHYGFPWRFGTQDNPQQFPDYEPRDDPRLMPGFYSTDNGLYRNDPTFPKATAEFTDPIINLGPDADEYRSDDGSRVDASDNDLSISTFTPHRSPLGLVFVDDENFPAPWQSDGDNLSAFLLNWGAAGSTFEDKGLDLLHLRLSKKDGNYEMNAYQIARDFQNPIDAVLIGNRLYVLNYGPDNAIWELTFEQ